MREILDILGRQIEVGDIVLRPIQARMTKVYILGISAKGVWISRKKDNRASKNWRTGVMEGYVSTDTYCDISLHNYILEKNAVIPENLKQFIKY